MFGTGGLVWTISEATTFLYTKIIGKHLFINNQGGGAEQWQRLRFSDIARKEIAHAIPRRGPESFTTAPERKYIKPYRPKTITVLHI